MPTAISASEPLASSWLPWVDVKSSPFSLFFHSLYYLGNEQVTLFINKQNKSLASRHITPFLQSKLQYWCWVALKVGLQATTFLVSRPLWFALNVVGLILEIKKYRLKRIYNTPLSSDAPPAFQKYLTCVNDPQAQRTFFAGLNSQEKEDFCRWYAFYSPEEIREFLLLDYKHKIFDDLLYQQFLAALVRRNSDVFACGYKVLCSELTEDDSFKTTRATQLQRAILKSLSLSSPSEKSPVITPPTNFVIDDRYTTALQLIFPYLANNDRARAACCCTLFRRLISNPDYTPPIQQDIKFKLWILMQLRPLPVDQLSQGQMEVFLERVARPEENSETHPILLAPLENLERWQSTAAKIPLPTQEDLSFCNLVQSYEIYSRWKEGTLPQEDKKEAYNTYRQFIHFSQHFAETVDPLTMLILETGSPEDKLIVYQIYEIVMPDCVKNFLILMKKYLQRSPEDFQSYFLNNFKELMTTFAARFDQERALEQWKQKASPLSWPDYISNQISERLEREGADTLFSYILAELKKRNDAATLTLFLHFLASFRFRLP